MPNSSPSFCFVITTWKRDLRYAKVLLESLQYWHPDVPIRVIVDGDVDARVLWKVPAVVAVDRTRDLQQPHGLDLHGLLSDLNLFFFTDFDYYIRLDADSVLVGDVVGGLRSRLPFDFLSLDGTQLDLGVPEKHRLFSQYAFSPAEMRELGEEFPDTNILYFSGGHFCSRAGLFDRDYLARWRPQMGATFRKDLLFKFNDQSFLNFAVNSLSQQGRLSAKLWHVTINGRATAVDFPDITLTNLQDRRFGEQRIIHYTGPTRRWWFANHNLGWSLNFFDRLWYQRTGRISRLVDEAARTADHWSSRATWSRYYRRSRTYLSR